MRHAVTKTPEQIRREAVEAARADLAALDLTLPHEDHERMLVQLYTWNYERIEREATEYVSALQSFAPAPLTVHVASWPKTEAQHVCTPSDPTTGGQYCTTCGRSIPNAVPAVVVNG